LGEGLENGAQFKLIGDHFPSRERSGANAAFLSALSLGPAIAAPLAGWLVVTVGWRGLFFWFTLPGLMVAVLLAIWLPRTEPPPPAERAARSGWGEALGAGPTCVATSYVLAGAALFVAFSAQSVAQSIAGLSCAAFFLYGGFGPFWAVAIDLIAPEMRGSVSGFVNFGGQIGGFFAPIVVGAIVGATKSYSGGFVFMIGALLLSAASLLWLEAAGNRGAQRGVPEETRLRPA
jgi:MFS family permease